MSLHQTRNSKCLELTPSLVSTASNANSRLLRLPQELKNWIYELVLGGQLIHVDFDSEKGLSHRLCQAKISEMEAQDIFAKSKEPWSAVELMNRHEHCYDVKTTWRHCSGCASQSNHLYEPHCVLDLTLSTCCRQIYHNAHSLIFSANTFSFTLPLHKGLSVSDLNFTLTRMKHFFLHRLHLDIMVYGFVEEIRWNSSFCYIARHFRSLRYFHIDIEQRPYDTLFLRRWHFQNPAHCTFLKDLPVLRVLKLRTATVTVADDHFLHSEMGKLWTGDWRQYRWSMAQKREWAAYITRILLRQEELGHAAGEGI